MKPSEHDGKHVLHIDGANAQHSGVIIGQSDEGDKVYVQSDNPNVSDAKWHFTVASELVPVLLKNAKLAE